MRLFALPAMLTTSVRLAGCKTSKCSLQLLPATSLWGRVAPGALPLASQRASGALARLALCKKTVLLDRGQVSCLQPAAGPVLPLPQAVSWHLRTNEPVSASQ